MSCLGLKEETEGLQAEKEVSIKFLYWIKKGCSLVIARDEHSVFLAIHVTGYSSSGFAWILKVKGLLKTLYIYTNSTMKLYVKDNILLQYLM